MWHKVIEWGNGFQEKYGEGSTIDCIYASLDFSFTLRCKCNDIPS